MADSKLKPGDRVNVKGIVIEADSKTVTIEVDDGHEGSSHRVTLSTDQADNAVKSR